MRLTTVGVSRNFENSVIGIVRTHDVPPDQRKQSIRFIPASGGVIAEANIDGSGYRAVLSQDELTSAPNVPYIHLLRETDHLRDGDIVALEGSNGHVRSLYRPYELHHHLFVTERCNSNCLMCS